MADSVQIQKNLRAAMKEALRIQDRFVAEPVFAKTGQGYLKSEGVGTIHTKKSGIVEELKEKHKERLARAQEELEKIMASPGTGSESYISDVLLFSKWAYRVGKGWYGFSLGSVPLVWTDVLDEFLTWLETQCPDFEIHQVKIKFRNLRLYVGTKTEFVIPDERIRSEISQLQNLLSIPQLPPIPVRAARKKRQKTSRKR